MGRIGRRSRPTWARDRVLRLNLVSAAPDRELDAIRNTVTNYENVLGLDDVISSLGKHSSCGRRVELLDVIGHSRLHGFLALGTWVIDDSAQTAASFSHLLRPSLEKLGVRTIRLLGCSTAVSRRGRYMLGRIMQATGCAVLGTRRYISRTDYGAEGFISDDALDVIAMRRGTCLLIQPRSESRDRKT